MSHPWDENHMGHHLRVFPVEFVCFFPTRENLLCSASNGLYISLFLLGNTNGLSLFLKWGVALIRIAADGDGQECIPILNASWQWK